MTVPKRHNTIAINILLAAVISLVINFSYLLAIREQDRRDFGIPGPIPAVSEETVREGILRVAPDGYGYIRSTDEGAGDSIYVSAVIIRRLGFRDGAALKVTAREPLTPGANKYTWKVLEIDGEPFDYGALYNRPSDNLVLGLQFGYYLALALTLLSIMTMGAARDGSVKVYLRRAAFALVVAVGIFFLLPVVKPRSGELIITAMNIRNGSLVIDPIDVLKVSFVLVFALLYGRTSQLISQKEDILLENEQLKNENLKARYDTLVNQINPHFLFNSLNSLSSLVREGHNDDALTYIDRLSDTFRYTIRNDPRNTAPLSDELAFVDAYKYLLEVRYDRKLFIDIDVEEDKLDWTLPTFSIQPLIENAVKHNSITHSKPLRISIRTQGDYVVVSNPVNPKISPEKGTGIGLENLSKRWNLLTGRDIEVIDNGRVFTVRLPFLNRAI